MREWGWVRDVAQALPQFLDAPKVWTSAALAVGIAEGVQQGAFGYAANATEENDSLTVASPSSVRPREALAPDQVELSDDAVLLGVALAERLGALAAAQASVAPAPPATPLPTDATAATPPGGQATGLRLDISATEDDLFVLSQALSKLRDLLEGGTMQLSLSVEARTPKW